MLYAQVYVLDLKDWWIKSDKNCLNSKPTEVIYLD